MADDWLNKLSGKVTEATNRLGEFASKGAAEAAEAAKKASAELQQGAKKLQERFAEKQPATPYATPGKTQVIQADGRVFNLTDQSEETLAALSEKTSAMPVKVITEALHLYAKAIGVEHKEE